MTKFYTLCGRDLSQGMSMVGMGFMSKAAPPKTLLDALAGVAIVHAPGYFEVRPLQDPLFGATPEQVQKLFKKRETFWLRRSQSAQLLGPAGAVMFVTVNRDLTLSMSPISAPAPKDPALAYKEGTLQRQTMEWLLSDDTGTSSSTIAILGADLPARESYGYPHDAADLGRCVRLLRQVPDLRERLPVVGHKYPPFQPFVDAWPSLERLYNESFQEGQKFDSKSTAYKDLAALIAQCDEAANKAREDARPPARARV